MSVPLIALRGITRVYGEGWAQVRALRGIDLTVEDGEFVAIMGPSGSGKSTAMNIIGCLDMPSGGSYRLSGIEVGQLDRHPRGLWRRHYLGFVFQGFNLLARSSALENVELPLIYNGLGAGERRKRALEALDKVGLADRGSHLPSELSGGQAQRVAIARAIVTRPRVLLADEPTGNLDTVRSAEIMELLRDLNHEEDINLLIVTHGPAMAGYARRLVHFVDVASETDTTTESWMDVAANA